jgi:hypothetical protein
MDSRSLGFFSCCGQHSTRSAKAQETKMQAEKGAPGTAVIPAKAGIQSSLAYDDFLERHGLRDHPLEPVIGLAEGETRWRMKTSELGAAPF